MFARRLKSVIFTGLVVVSLPAFAKSLTVCTDASPEGFDVVQYNSLVTTNASADPMMNRLVEYDDATRKIVPSLASTWSVSADGLTYTFTLRNEVSFHQTNYFRPTRHLNAEDVVQSFSRMLNPEHPWHKVAPNGYPHAQSMQLAKLIKQVAKVDAATVRFELYHPDASFLSVLTMGFASIYSAEYLHQLMSAGRPGDLNVRPIGTGPFIFKSYQKDSVVRYRPNPFYFGSAPKISQLIYAITPDPSVRFQKLKTGECQLALAPKPQDVASARSVTTLKILETPAFMTAFVALNTQKKPLDHPLVRQAINLAFNRPAYLKAVFGGEAIAANLVYPPTTWSYAHDIKPWPQHITLAKTLLVQAGYPEGFETTLWVRPSGSALNPNPRVGAELLQSDLIKIGVRAHITVVEWGELIKRGKAGEHDMLFMGWAGDTGDPDSFMTPLFSCAAVESGTNFARYCDSRLDQWIRSAKEATEANQRLERYHSAQKLIHDQALWLPLAHPIAYVLARVGVSGYRVSPFGRQNFANVLVR